jgi:hypothetical protein
VHVEDNELRAFAVARLEHLRSGRELRRVVAQLGEHGHDERAKASVVVDHEDL